MANRFVTNASAYAAGLGPDPTQVDGSVGSEQTVVLPDALEQVVESVGSVQVKLSPFESVQLFGSEGSLQVTPVYVYCYGLELVSRPTPAISAEAYSLVAANLSDKLDH